MNKTVSALLVAAAIGTLTLGAWAATPPSDRPGDGDGPAHRRGPPSSVERVAMHNLIARQLAQRTGRTESEIADMLQSTPPHEVAQSLGLERDTMQEVFASARTTLIDEAVQAQMITTAQADELKKAPPPGRFRHRRSRGDDDRGARGPDDMTPPDDRGE